MLSKLTGIWRFIVPGVLVLLLVLGIVLGVKSCNQHESDVDNQFINSGELIERGAASQEVINHVQEARNAVDNPTADERIVVCEKYDRNCKDGQ